MSKPTLVDNPRMVYIRILAYVKPYRSAFVFAVLGMIIVAATEVGMPAIMQPLLDGTFVEKDPFFLKMVPLAILAIFVFRGIGSFCVTYFLAWVGRHVVKDLRLLMFEHLLTLPASFYDKQQSGKLISKLIYDAEQVSEASSRALTVIVQDSLSLIGLLAFMFYVNWELTLLFLTVGPVLTIIIIYVNKRLRKISRRLQESVGDVTHISQETIDSNRVVKIFGGQEYEKNKFDSINRYNRHQHMKMVSTNAMSVPIVQLFAASLLSVIIYYATHMEEQLSVGTFMSFISAMLLLFPPIKRLTQVSVILQRGIAAGQSIFGFLDVQKEQDCGTRQIDEIEGNVRFNNISFCYDQEKGMVLRDVSLDVKAGESVALVGRSGSGKSTLASLIPRFYSPTSGTIEIDGTDIRDIRLPDLRKNIALVSQEVKLFNDTIEHNIAYGRLDTADREKVIAASKAANAWEFIETLPEGLDTPVGEHGVMLSGGQRQRLAIARAILKDAPILILDEATSALDSESEKQVQSALDELMKGRTTFVIAHRLSTIENADKIVVMSEGRIVEVGTHEELLAKKGHYTALYEMQFGEPHEEDEQASQQL